MNNLLIQSLISDGFNAVESASISQACMICVRISRHLKDYLPMAIFLLEISSSRDNFVESFLDEVSELKEEESRYLHRKSLEIFTNQRKSPKYTSDDGDEAVYEKSVAELEFELKQWKEVIASDYTIPSGMSSFDIAAFEDRNREVKPSIRFKILDLTTILERTRTRCFNYLIKIEKIVDAQNKQDLAINNSVLEVMNYFKEIDQDIYIKFNKINELSSQDDSESQSLLLTEIRRTYHCVANHIYPPQSGRIKCVDGEERMLGEDNYLNRVKEFIRININSSRSSELLLLELEYVDKMAKKIDGLANKGVHGKVEYREARQCLFTFYAFISNLIFIKREKN